MNRAEASWLGLLEHDRRPRHRPPPTALQPPWWDGGPYDVSETVRIICEMLLDLAA